MPDYRHAIRGKYTDPKAAPRAAHWLSKLEAAYLGQRVVEHAGCRLCPHKGLPLDSLPREADGSVVCRGHGLTISAAGVVVPRSAAP